jgi:hypothetical protein
MVKMKAFSVVGLVFSYLCSSIVMADGISENIKGQSKGCLSSEELFEAATRADCVDGDVFGSCWMIGDKSFLRGALIGNAVATAGIVKAGTKALKNDQKFWKEYNGVYGATPSANKSALEQSVVEFEYLNDRKASQANYKENSRKYFETLKSLGISEGEIAALLGVQDQYYLRLVKIAQLKDMINDPTIPSSQKEPLKKNLDALSKEVKYWREEGLKLRGEVAANFVAKKRSSLLKSGAISVAAGVAAGTAFSLATEYFQTEKLAKCVNASEGEANDLKGYVSNRGGLFGDCRVGVPSSVIYKIANFDQASRDQFFLKRPKLCQLIKEQNTHQQKQQEEFVKQLSYKVASCTTGSDGSLKINYNLLMGGKSYQGSWSKHGDMSEVQSTLIPGTFADVGVERSFTMAIDPKDGEFRTFKTSHPKVRSDWNVSQAASGDVVNPMKSYHNNYLHGECRYMDSALEQGNYHGNAKFEIGCSAARLTQAFKYISQGLVGECAQQLKSSVAPGKKAQGKSVQ